MTDTHPSALGVPDEIRTEPSQRVDLTRRAVAEGLGTAFLLAVVVGSGIMAERLSTDVGLQLLESSIATGVVLAVLIVVFADISGAHFNPAVTLAERIRGGIDTRTATAYLGAQVIGGVAGVVAANLMFDLDAVAVSATQRWGAHLWFAEVIATFGLLTVIYGAMARRASAAVVGAGVGAYIAGAYWFTSSTSFANPAVTLARTLSDTFAGIDPSSVVPFIAAQLLGAVLAVATWTWLTPHLGDR